MTTRAVVLAGLVRLTSAVAAAGAPEGEMVGAVHVSLAPTWFDPAETPSVITPLMVLYAMPPQGRPLTPR